MSFPNELKAQKKASSLPNAAVAFHSQPAILTVLLASTSQVRMAADPTSINPAGDTFIFTEPFISAIVGGKLCTLHQFEFKWLTCFDVNAMACPDETFEVSNFTPNVIGVNFGVKVFFRKWMPLNSGSLQA